MSETAFTLLVREALPDGRFVVTNSSDADVPNGTVFVQVAVERGELTPGGTYGVTEHQPAIAVALRLSSIEFFRRSIECIPKGHHAGVDLNGEDAGQLKVIVDQYPRPWSVVLRSAAAP